MMLCGQKNLDGYGVFVFGFSLFSVLDILAVVLPHDADSLGERTARVEPKLFVDLAG